MEEKKHPIQGVMDTAMSNIKDMVDVNTIVGDPITTNDGTVIIPVSKVSFGFASGGSDFCMKNQAPDANCFGGGSGAGVSINPVAFLVVSSNGNVNLISIDQRSFTAVDKVIDMVPGLIDKFKKKDKKENSADGE